MISSVSAGDRQQPLPPAELRQRRLALKLSQEGLGMLLGVTGNTVARWERGRQRLASPGLVRLALERLELEAGEQPSSLNGRGWIHHNGLPAALTSFVGRQAEVATLRQGLRAARLVTLSGAAGIGKTRLAIEVAADVRGHYADGVCLVELAAIADPAQVLPALAAAVRVADQPGRPLLDTVIATLSLRQVLLVLDNCEHVLEACAGVVTSLLKACPAVSILATSREVLGVPGELAWRVPPLSLPDAEGLQTPDQLQSSEAVALFVERARATAPDFTLTSANAPSVAELCRRLDGLPLALELAAARMRALGPRELVERLEDRFALLVDVGRRVPSHHQTLRATIDWSYSQLSEPEQRLFPRLAVFAGGCTLEAAEATCSGGGLDTSEVLPLLSRLVDRSLVVAEHSVEGGIRFRLLETLHAYAWELLHGAERAEAQRQHAEFWLAFAERMEPRLVEADQEAWFARTELELANVRAVLSWCLAQPEYRVELGLRLACALVHFWHLGPHLREGYEWLRRLLAAAPAGTPDRVGALFGAGFLAYHLGDPAAAGAAWDEALLLARAHGNARYMPSILVGIGSGRAGRGDWKGAEDAFSEGHDLAERQGDAFTAGVALYWLGHVARAQGHYPRAERALEASLAVSRTLGGRREMSYLLLSLGQLAQQMGEPERALVHHREALAVAPVVGDTLGVIWGLEGITASIAALGQARRAALLLGAVEVLRVRFGATPDPVPGWGENRARAETSARRQLGQAAFVAAYRAGQQMTLDKAIAEALHADEPVEFHSVVLMPAGSCQAPLTAREREVAALVAQGLTNRQLAERLIISPGTAQRHVANILAKLGFASRVKLAAWVLERDRDAVRPALHG